MGFKSRLPKLSRSGEEQQEGDQQGEDAQRLGDGEAEDQAAELAVGGGRVAQRALQELAEQVADADGGSSRADGGEAGADELGGGGVHVCLLPLGAVGSESCEDA